MKKILNFVIISSLLITFIGCGSTPVVEETVETPAPTPVVEETPAPEPDPVVEETPAPVEEVMPEVDEEEYTRSIKGQDVSKEQFAKDKAIILKRIEELDAIMESQDFTAWLDYIAPSSKEFYAKPRKIVTNLGVKVNNGLQDYFDNIFIKSRAKAAIDEIRYVSPTVIKAVEVTGPGKIKTYYNFEKFEDEWLVVLPTEFALN